MPKKISGIAFVFFVFLAIDLTFVVLHFLLGGKVDFFNLDAEHTAPAYYQGVQMILSACAVFAQMALGFALKKLKLKDILILCPLMFGFIFLALDEVGQIHEHLSAILNALSPDKTAGIKQAFGSFGSGYAGWIIFYSPVFIFGALYLFFLIRYFYKKQAKLFPVFALATLLFVSIPFFEYLNTSKAVLDTWRYVILMPIEEFSEMLGATLFLIFNLRFLKDNISKEIEKV